MILYEEKKMKRKGLKFISFMLALIIAACTIPVTANATTITEPQNTEAEVIEELTTIEAEMQYLEINPVREIVSLREENIKHFRLPDGTYEMIVYDYPVHRKNDAGEWKDIDNSLSLTTVSGSHVYATADSRMTFSNAALQNSRLVSINENGYSISMSILSNNSGLELSTISPTNEVAKIDRGVISTSSITNAPTRSALTSWNTIEEATAIDNRASILYENALLNTDIEYVMVGNNVKENIIIKSPANHYEYSFSLALKNLIAECDSYGNIRLLDNQTSECEYIMPAPFMYDAANALSYDVSYELTAISNGTYAIKVSANSDWINSSDRVFPVTIDPSINTNTNISDTHVWGSYAGANYGDDANMFVSSNSIALIKFPIPNIPEGATLNVPNLYVYYYANVSTGNTKIGAYKILNNWNENTVTWNTKPTIDSTIQSNATLYHSTDNTSSTNKVSIRFTVRNAVEDWLENPSTNYGIAIKYISGVDTPIYLNTIESGTQYPRISISYNFEFEDGIYAIKNMGDSNSYLTAPHYTIHDGVSMQRVSFANDSASLDSTNIKRLFKISYDVGNRYIIRSMVNNNFTFGISGTSVVTKEIPALDDDVASADTFYIEWDGYGFLLRPYGSDYVIKINSASSSSISTVEKSSVTSTGRWNLVKYDYEEPRAHLSVNGLAYSMKMGKTYIGSPAYWCTTIDVEPYIYISNEYAGIATGTWNSSTQRFTLNLHEPGTFVLTTQIKSGNSVIYEADIWLESLLLVENGSYFIKNVKLENYVHIHSNNELTYGDPGEKIKVGNYSGHPIQIWNFEYLGGGYYRIKSYFSKLLLTVQSDYINTNNKSLIQDCANNLSTQMWKISQSSSGNLVFRPKSAESYTTDWCMSAGVSIFSDRAVEQREYTDDSDYKDEWRVFNYRKTMLLALNEENIDRALYYDDIKNMLACDDINNYSAVEILEFTFTMDFIEYFTTSEIVVLHTHGKQDGIYYGENYLFNDKLNNYVSMQDLENVDLSNLNFAFLLTCSTAAGYDESHITNNDPVNIVEQFVISGAETVVGFSDITVVDAANLFVKEVFYQMTANQSSIGYAISSVVTSDWITQDIQPLAVIAGNENYTID